MSSATATPPTNPFPGLRPFHEDEVHLFFGRESQVDAMVDKLSATRFLAVVGTSGSGKSSLVNCGLRPALHGGLMARAGTAWRMAQFRPGSDPLREMARALARDGVLFRDYQAGGLSLSDIVDTTLRMSKLGLIDIVEQARLAEGTNLLVVVDQFEELFRYQRLGAGGDDKDSDISEQATAFVNLLLEAGNQTKHPIYIVLTMRSDFLGDCAQFPGLAEAINAGQYLVPRMTREERRAAIIGPVGVGGAKIAPVLLTRLVNDVGDNPDQLSILQHALNRTWAYWENEGSVEGPLELTHYEAIGSMAHALDQHAEKAYAELGTERQQQICEKIFKALTDKATDPRGIRRPTTLGTLCALADETEPEVTEMIDVFRKPSRSFLMPPAGEALIEDTIIDISHESLMRVWQRLNTWADEEAQSAQGYRRLAEAVVLHGEGKAGLWRDPELQLALDWRDHNQPNETWAARYHPGFANAIHFLDDSVAERDRLARQKEEQRQRELIRARKISWGAGIFCLLLLGVAVYAYNQTNKAEAEAETARAAFSFMEGLFEVSAPDKARGKGKNIRARDLLDTGAEKIKLLGNPELKARMNASMGKVYRELGLYSESEPLLQQAVEIRKLELGDEHPDTLKSIHNLAILYERQGLFDKAEPRHHETLEIRKRELGDEHPDTLKSMHNLAIVYHRQGHYAKAKKLYRETLEIRMRELGDEYPDTLKTMHNLAVLLMRQEHYAEAETLYRQTLETRKRVLGDDHPDTLSSMNSLANLLKRQKHYAEAKRLYLETRTLNKEVFGLKHPYTASTLYNLACLAAVRGKSAVALDFLGQSVEAGYANPKIDEDPELISLRSHPGWDALVARAQENAKAQRAE